MVVLIYFVGDRVGLCIVDVVCVMVIGCCFCGYNIKCLKGEFIVEIFIIN